MIPALVFFYFCFFPLVETDCIEVPVMEGDSFTLRTNRTEILNDRIEWRFGLRRTLITSINKRIITYGTDDRLKERLQVDIQTGDLTITNVSNEYSGVYKLDINDVSTNKFNVTVYAPVPAPVIIRYSPQCSSSSSSVSKSVLLCSVLNVSHVTLSWYKGSSLLSNISVSDLSISISLPLEVEYQDRNAYRCAINNPISSKTQHLDISELCQTPSGSDHDWSGRTEAIIRLVTAVVVGVAAAAAVVVLVYDIRSRRIELDWKIKFIKQ